MVTAMSHRVHVVSVILYMWLSVKCHVTNDGAMTSVCVCPDPWSATERAGPLPHKESG